ncbi:MAG: Phospho-2-dehydro-3-deoxyheptonate aldolase [candidate division TA06 bacterium ADurb.Bin417]|uniref:Phospho-2-dehydro-3-deoxyheptonate aldolase n=1 Tax=candidate division TA06 bacterium ADurb.Bin417 TaxID=1852828 RepID=A0A1V5MJD9_UNCT6|nr:MAG: Phospho-2-dehydro-3-deoxyheptonate aldolase [candidate division TA06 bacterium ADurb.Bin417]
MIITLRPGTTEEGVREVLEKIKDLGFTPHLSSGKERVVIGVIGENAILTREQFEAMITAGGVEFGGSEFVVTAGPCAIESREQILETARAVRAAGARVLRGGAFKPRTSPYAFQGLGEEGLKYLAEAGKELGMPTVTEVMDPRQVELVCRYADIIQIGARNMQNFDLLKEVGRAKRPVLLKRGMSARIEEFLMSAEYILSQGNYQVILCERGVRTFEDATRFTLDLAAVPLVKELSHLPIVVDPSHGTGRRNLIAPMSRAALAAGADGLLIEVHPKPEAAVSDGFQSLRFDDFKKLMASLQTLAPVLERRI